MNHKKVMALAAVPLCALLTMGAKGCGGNAGMIGSGIGGKHQIKVYPSRQPPTSGPGSPGYGVFYSRPGTGMWVQVRLPDGTLGWVSNARVDTFIQQTGAQPTGKTVIHW